MQLIFICL
jgi:hypothetical protein